jgi:hypothetical protein
MPLVVSLTIARPQLLDYSGIFGIPRRRCADRRKFGFARRAPISPDSRPSRPVEFTSRRFLIPLAMTLVARSEIGRFAPIDL